MKSLTHNLFSIGLCFYSLSHSGVPLPQGFLLAVWLSFAINSVIDILGHTGRGSHPVRSLLTHSVFTAPLWGGFVAVASIVIPFSILKIGIGPSWTLLALGAGLLVSYAHLFLDALTEGGVFLGRGRIAIAHFSYNSPLLNVAFSMIGLVIIITLIL